jgi:YD repeat-containing protein
MAAGVAHATAYVYDANGRIRAVTNSTGASAEYVYDAMGNLLQVESVPAGELKIFAFSPDHGAIGATVAIAGQGFSATPADNAVEFNGTPATVTEATPTSLTTSVPVGATTGKITLTVGTQTVTGDDVFTVDDTGLAPVVTSFSPGVGLTGTQMTVLGQHFEPVPNQTTPAIDGWSAPPQSATDTQVQFAVSPSMGSGKVSVTTPYGQGTSSADFYVLPPGLCGNNAANVKVTERIAVGGSTGTVAIPAGNCAAVLFDAISGEWLTFQGSAITSSASNINYSVYDTHNRLVVNGTLSAASPSIHLPQSVASGTYSIWIEPDTSSASLALTLTADQEVTVNGASATMGTVGTRQTERFVFTTQGGNVALGLSGISVSNGDNIVDAGVYDANNSMVASNDCSQSRFSCGLDMQNLAAGTYQVIVAPQSNDTIGFTVDASADLTGMLPLNALTATTIARYGQTETLTFSARAGQTVALQAVNLATQPSGDFVEYYMYTPDGQQYQQFSAEQSYFFQNLPNLPQTGTYKVYMVPTYGALLSSQMEVESPVTTLTVNGSPESFATTEPGQYMYLSFTNPQTGSVGLGLSGMNESNGDSVISVDVYDMNNKYVGSESCSVSNGACGLDMQNLAAGNYQVFVKPQGVNDTMSFTAALSMDLSGTLSPNSPRATNIARYGQTEALIFSATQGQTIAFAMSAQTTVPAGDEVMYTLYTPDGVEYQRNDGNGTAFTWNSPDLPQTGTYKLYLQPNNGAQLSQSTELVTGAMGALTTNGSSYSFSTLAPGQYVYLNFTANAGDNLGLGISGLEMSPGSSAWVGVYDSAGAYVASTSCSVGDDGCGVDLQALVGGSYQVIVEPQGNSTMQFTATLSRSVAGALPIDTTESVDLAARGQTGTYTFNATAGQALALVLGAQATVPTGNYVNYTLYAPDGSVDESGNLRTAFTWNLSNVSQSGVYKLHLAPDNGATLSESVELVPGVTGALTVGGSAQNFAAPAPGQNIYLTFATSTTENLSFDISSLQTLPDANGSIDVTVRGGSGNNVGSEACYAHEGTCVMNLANLAPGSYQIVVAPQSNDTASFAATLAVQ